MIAIQEMLKNSSQIQDREQAIQSGHIAVSILHWTLK